MASQLSPAEPTHTVVRVSVDTTFQQQAKNCKKVAKTSPSPNHQDGTGISFDICDKHRRELEENGACFLKNAFGESWVEKLRRGVDLNMAYPGVLCDEHAGSSGY